MQNYSYPQKIEKLLEHFKYSTKLADALNVSRISIVNWRDGASISEENKLKIDYLFYEKVFLPELENKKQEAEKYIQKIISKNYFNLITSIDFIEEISKYNSFGSLEIETDINNKEFEKIIEGEYIEKDIQKRKVLEANNLYNLTKIIITDTIKENINLSIETIKNWHLSLFLGIREDAGKFSTKIRKIKDTNLTLTHPEDIEEELNYWIKSYKDISNIYDIAKAHEHFELIHPFGDGNGRIGRLIIAHQAIKLKLLPPLINKQNKALYYASLYKAQTSGNILPLAWFLCKAIEEMENNLIQ
jgi:Fic family protein